MEIKEIDLSLNEQMKGYITLIEWSRNYIANAIGLSTKIPGPGNTNDGTESYIDGKQVSRS